MDGHEQSLKKVNERPKAMKAYAMDDLCTWKFSHNNQDP
jgi:hypothetical protein